MSDQSPAKAPAKFSDKSPIDPGGPILGIDPGSAHTGYGIIKLKGSKATLISAGRISPCPDWPLPKKLSLIHREVSELVCAFQPSAMALEDIFTFKNPQAAIKLAHARAAAILAAALRDVPVFEYPPALVKNSVAGSGRAEKSQVAFIVSKLLNLTETLSADASDALAVALCHSGQALSLSGQVGSKAASRNRAGSWRRLSAGDLAALGYKVEDQKSNKDQPK
jgi:crossover junction endodeoxyribonuclease RuvC